LNVKRYKPDFPAMMRVYETNYAQLRRLIPRSNQVGDEINYQIDSLCYRLAITETTRYTTVVVIQQVAPKVGYGMMPELTVRLYHDALIAEVCASQQIYRFKARYDYPQQILFQSDEKHQINQFLKDWLKFCLMYGTTLVFAC
jgi:uncharacterized protein YqiB (DUF1249 family)